jgi:magnesium-transporting ATPase (P-type)
LIISTILDDEKDFLTNATLLEVLNIGIIAVTLMLVSIPEGLPLAISISIALSLKHLKEDSIVIKNG